MSTTGYHLPAGSVVVGNAWAILHDKEEYMEPSVFRPERFLKDGKLDSDVHEPLAAFGFGRRVCPGKHIAKSTLWITVASILTIFKISKAIDADGNVIEPSQEYTSALILQSRHPAPFKCTIKPRSKEAEMLIRSSLDCSEGFD